MSEPTPLEAIFFAALEKAPDQRAAYLNEACAGDADLRRRIERMLAAQAEAASFLETPPSAIVAIASPTIELPAHEKPGTQIGPYKLLQQIGEGGMGVVYMAEQTQPVQRKVALKVIKPGMDSHQIIARFEAERQALAMMDHVNIARVLDAGTTEQGRPYFVMELVHGVPITQYCDDNRLTPRQRLELFVPVCQAIQHAHQKGIIHRDIKPSNVMVTLYDGKPVPKVIDFGVAKATEQKLTERTLFTQYGTMVGTLEYMSPEQAETSALGVDTRSDIYSLGVLLYELLTGSTPLSSKRMKEAAYAEILRMIKEEEPPKPSTRLSDSGEALASISAQRHMEPAKLAKLMRGELDWIVMKTLEKDRNRRYETANGFAADVQRYLNDEPVQACPPSAWYRFRKFARRNKAALLTMSLLFAALVVLVAGLALSNVRVIAERNQKSQALMDKETALAAARQSALKAEAESKRTKKNFLVARIAIREVIAKAALGDGEWSQLTPPLRKKFSEEAVKFYEGLLQQSSDPSDRYETAIGYRSLGLLHTRAGSGVHDRDQAEDCYRKSTAILDELSKEYPAEAEYRYQLSASQRGLASFLWFQRDHSPEADVYFRKAAELLRQLVSEDPGSFDYIGDFAKLLIDWQAVSGPPAVERDLAFLRMAVLLPAQQEKIGHAYRLHAFALTGAGHRQEAERFLRQALAQFDKVTIEVPGSHKYWHFLADTHRRLGNLLTGQGRDAEVEEALRRSVEIHDKQVERLPDWMGNLQEWAASYADLANLLKAQGRLDEAEQVFRRAISLREPLPDVPPGPRLELGKLYAHLGQWDKAVKVYTKVIEVDPSRWEVWTERAFGHFHQQEFDKAIPDFSKAINLDPNIHTNWWHRGHAYLALKQWDKAAADFGKAVEDWPDGGEGWYWRAVAFAQLGQLDSAMADLRQAAAKGFHPLEHIKNDPSLEPLRKREDFGKLLKELEQHEKSNNK